MSRITAALTAIALLALSVPAFAQDNLPAPEATQEQTQAVETAKVTSYDYENDNITGTLNKPLSDVVVGDAGDSSKSLIQVRQSFVDEMIKSVDDL